MSPLLDEATCRPVQKRGLVRALQNPRPSAAKIPRPTMRSMRSLRLTPSFLACSACFGIQNPRRFRSKIEVNRSKQKQAEAGNRLRKNKRGETEVQTVAAPRHRLWGDGGTARV